MNNEDILKVLSEVKHPENNNSIVNLKIVQNIKVEADKISLNMVFAPGDTFGKTLKAKAKEILEQKFPNYKINILELRKEYRQKTSSMGNIGMDEVKNVIVVASGKGGVGKSTTTVNLAITLANMGYSVGLVDADIYGPSIPKMFGLEDAKPVVREYKGVELIEPIEKYGIRMLSIGFFISAETPIVWRGPVATTALRQLTKQSNWNKTDFLLIDLPPGTGDVHITVAQELKVSGAVIVTTPQDIALTDALKGINMFKSEGVKIPILGIIENMAWFTPAELPNNKYYLFGKDGGKKMAKELNLPLLAQVPLIQSVRESADIGIPIVLKDSVIADIYKGIAEKIIDGVS